ncbi:MAG: protein phosphatase 2C domain-containing protein [Planctomycetota bacterium]
MPPEFCRRCSILIEAYGHTDKGLKRPGNEDSFYCSSEEGIAIVADGMGGHASGEVASALAVRIIREEILNHLAQSVVSGEKPTDKDTFACTVLRKAIEHANTAIHQKTAQQVDKAAKMGTTIVALLATEEYSAIASVGDSRIYILREGKLIQLSQDHSLVNEQVKANLITEEEARKSIYRHIVTRALGMKEEVEVDTMPISLKAGDVVMMCSDGLYDLVGDELIKQVMLDADGDLKSATHSLIDLANAKGGEDNITVAMIKSNQAIPFK